MASSVFADSPVSTNESRMCGELPSDLVVVYGKKGVNVDSNGLDNLLEDRNISSVSVVRLTSPTPSMKDEEEQQEDDEGIGRDDSDPTLDSKQVEKEKPEIVGLTIEEFYPLEETKKLAKEILDYAGVSNPLQIKIDYEFQRFVIQNDHCYTPLTSPSQGKPKSGTGEGAAETSNKQPATVARQLVASSRVRKATETSVSESEDKKNESGEDEDEGSDYTETSESAESDNDRDSDLDFSVNDRGRRRKANTKKARKPVTKTPRKQRQSLTEKDADDEQPPKARGVAAVRVAGRQSLPGVSGHKVVQKPTVAVKTVAKPPLQRQPSVDPVVVSEPKPRVVQLVANQKVLQQQQHIQQRQLQQQQIQMQIQQQQHLIQQQIQQKQLQQDKLVKQQQQPPAPAQTAQKIFVIKKDGTTSTVQLVEGTAARATPPPSKPLIQIQSCVELKVKATPIVPAPSEPPLAAPAQQHYISGHSMSNKGFMPLGLESVQTKNQLPAQISIQAHNKPVELAIEDDKQLDLIDSIVKDEMQKTNVVIKPNTEANRDIPQIVKMLESTERAILNKKPVDVTPIATASASTSSATAATSFTSGVEHFDIANADLLDNPDDDLYKDLLQHVAELRNDKQLQEVIEKQGYGTPSPLTLSDSPGLIPHQAQAAMQQPVGAAGELQPPIAKKDPIKIIRGDGRVITLPPIEAPTTRAKRRAQSQVGSPATPTVAKPAAAAVAAVKVDTVPRRDSVDQRGAAAAAGASRKRVSISSAQSTPKEEEMETEESQEDEDSEDDPNKLWCICRQPHNNRFMICCDKCEDWFHGTCVNITKAMGREMENTGKEWTCPNCIKEKKKQPIQKKLTEIFEKKPAGPLVGTPKSKAPPLARKSTTPNTKSKLSPRKPPAAIADPVPTTVKVLGEVVQRKITDTIKVQQKATATIQSGPPPLVKTGEAVAGEAKTAIVPAALVKSSAETGADPSKPKPVDAALRSCIVCKKSSRPNSIYCSDDCIRRHAQNALTIVNKANKVAAAASSQAVPLTPEERKKKMPSSFEEALTRASESTPKVRKVERVYVFERKSGRIFTGSNAPTPGTLKKWLQENPTFEVVQPGSPQALAIERSKQKQASLAPLNVSASNISSASVTVTTPTTPTPPPPLKKISDPKPDTTPRLQKLQLPEAGKSQNQKQATTDFTARSPPTPSPQQLRKNPPQLSVKLSNERDTKAAAKTSTTPTQQQPLKKYPAQVSIKPPASQPANEKETKTPAKTPRKQQNQTTDQKSSESSGKDENDPIRVNVRKTLKEQILTRMNEMKLPETDRLTVSQVETFATDVESEMFNLFNKDTGAKYKAKYRSLMFNVKDRKNQTLFQKILERKIEPPQLVRMSAEEMASQELAQWRENENKHQLEMIKKSELDLLSCKKNYVLKTHKGEEVIESKTTDQVSLDITIPVEDVVTVLNNSAVSSTSEAELMSPGKVSLRGQSVSDDLSQDADSSQATSSATDTSKATSSKDGKAKKHDKERDRHNRTRERHKSSSSRRRSRSRSRSRERRHKSPHNDDRHKSPAAKDERDKSPHRDDRHKAHHKHEKEERHRSPHRDDKRKSPHHSSHKHRSPHNENSGDEKSDKSAKSKKDDNSSDPPADSKSDLKNKSTAKNVPKSKEKDSKQSKTEEAPQSFNLIDKIIESTKTVEEAANLVPDKEKSEPKPQTATSSSSTSAPVSTTTAAPSVTPTKPTSIAETSSGGDSDQEPTSTVNIPTRREDQYKKYASDLDSILWNGSINMIDVATFQIVIQPVVGVTLELDTQLPAELDVVGRIGPDTVWDYIGKIRKSPNKEIVIVRLVPSCESENMAYSALYKYLNNRRRLGVVKTISPMMKDFYILPLGHGKELPEILQPQETVELFEDDTRPDLLLGIIIRIMSKRSASSAGQAGPSKVPRKTNLASVIKNTTSSTPPGSPRLSATKKSETRTSIISATRLPPKSDDSIDINSIISPTPKISKTAFTADDADEPYSPGGSSDDDLPLPSESSSSVSKQLTDDELKRKMDDINRQIEARKQEIAGMLGMDQNSSSYSSTATPETKPSLANISIPSNIHQILASIKPSQDSPSSSAPPASSSIVSLLGDSDDDDEEYVPTPAPKSLYKPLLPPPPPPVDLLADDPLPAISSGESRLSQLSEAELLRMVPDDVDLRTNKTKTSTASSLVAEPEPPTKRGRWLKEPPPPGLEGDFI